MTVTTLDSSASPFSSFQLRGRGLRAGILFTSGLSFCLFGYDQGVLGGLLASEPFLASLGHPNATIQGLIASIFNVGCMLGCAISASLGLRLGRRAMIAIGCLFVVLGGAGQACSYGAAQMLVFRVVAGVGIGCITSTIPVWLSELSGAAERGRVVALQLCVVLSGNVTAYWVDYGMSFVEGSRRHPEAAFRFPIALQCLFPILALLPMPWLPESPRVLYYWGRAEEADDVIERLGGNVTADRDAVLQSIEFEKNNIDQRPLWRSLFWDDSHVRNSRRLFIAVALQAIQQMTGCNVITYYQAIIFQQSIGLDNGTARLVAGCSAIIFWLGTFPAVYLIEKMGRRNLLLAGATLCGSFMLAFTVILARMTPNSAAMGWAAAAMIFCWEFCFGATWNCVVWIYAPEISPLRFRHINGSLAVMSEWAFTFLTVMITPPALENIGWRVYIVFVVCTAAAIPFVYFLCPETAGKTLEELDLAFSDGTHPISTVDQHCRDPD